MWMKGNEMNRKDLTSLVAEKQAILFDLFHTLTALGSTWANGTMTHEILGVEKEAWYEQLLEKSRYRLAGDEKDPYTIVKKLAHAIDPSIPHEVIVQATEKRIERFQKGLINIPGINKVVIGRLKNAGKKIGLISNADVMEIIAWPQSPISHLFDSVIFSCDVGYAKPEKEIYDISMRQLNVEPKDCVFVGDGGSGELPGAKERGIDTVLMAGVIREVLQDKIVERSKDADFVIDSLEELLPDSL